MGNCLDSSAKVAASQSSLITGTSKISSKTSNSSARSTLTVPSCNENSTESLPTPRFEGEGGFGYVFKGWIDEHTLAAAKPGSGMVVAVKKLKPEGFQGHKEWLTEVNYLGQLPPPTPHRRRRWRIIGDHFFRRESDQDSRIGRSSSRLRDLRSQSHRPLSSRPLLCSIRPQVWKELRDSRRNEATVLDFLGELEAHQIAQQTETSPSKPSKVPDWVRKSESASNKNHNLDTENSSEHAGSPPHPTPISSELPHDHSD